VFARHTTKNRHMLSSATYAKERNDSHNLTRVWLACWTPCRLYKPASFYQFLRRLGYFPTETTKRATHGLDFEGSKTFKWDGSHRTKYIQSKREKETLSREISRRSIIHCDQTAMPHVFANPQVLYSSPSSSRPPPFSRPACAIGPRPQACALTRARPQYMMNSSWLPSGPFPGYSRMHYPQSSQPLQHHITQQHVAQGQLNLNQTQQHVAQGHLNLNQTQQHVAQGQLNLNQNRHYTLPVVTVLIPEDAGSKAAVLAPQFQLGQRIGTVC
jgi:hypothetical protein